MAHGIKKIHITKIDIQNVKIYVLAEKKNETKKDGEREREREIRPWLTTM